MRGPKASWPLGRLPIILRILPAFAAAVPPGDDGSSRAGAAAHMVDRNHSKVTREKALAKQGNVATIWQSIAGSGLGWSGLNGRALRGLQRHITPEGIGVGLIHVLNL
ncbi:hypothetical protein [Inquilinus sp. Marseille-Q2685]|uniref:hypothetical protein n=1 Tax=Inquilinus sp. Marseille-Q2685 TaxID=2866581 RepID=UPI001CE415A4|nr:hypothetical protein [Inquilinus sp. Marseille-Q2685]